MTNLCLYSFCSTLEDTLCLLVVIFNNLGFISVVHLLSCIYIVLIFKGTLWLCLFVPYFQLLLQPFVVLSAVALHLLAVVWHLCGHLVIVPCIFKVVLCLFVVILQ